MAKTLVIVESPAKAKTIEKFLGKSHYTVKASVGHVRDLPKSTLGVDIDNNFEPRYINIRGKGDLIKELKKEAKKAKRVYLATDPDREGEAISWHLAYILGIDENDECRIEFNEITKDAIKKAIKNPRNIDLKLVDAQQARRVLDRLLGYQISPILWAKVRKGLSAGRVQSVTTKLICEREREINDFVPKEYWSLEIEGKTKDNENITFKLKREIKDTTILVSIMYANNEIGTIQPIKEITEIAHAHGALMHTDAVQAAGNIPVDVKDLGVDLMSMSGHKIYGPKGIGSLYIRKGVRIHNLIHGGAQERKKRAGTENIPAIVGYGKAAEMAKENMEHHIAELTRLREKLIAGVMERIPHTRLNGHRTDRLPGNTNFSFEFIEGEGILLLLDQVGIAGSSGSACTSGSLDPSHVLMAIGLTHEWAHGSLRLTVGDFTTDEDIDYILEKLPPVIERLRMLSPLYNTYLKEQKEKQAVK